MRQAQQSRAFATFTAVMTVALVGVALATLGTMFAWQARRTQQAASDAQLRQLLLAGGAAAASRLQAEPGPIDVTLTPPGLEDATVRVDVSSSGASATATIEARLGAGVARQTLAFERGDGGWRVAAARLERPR